MAGGYLPARRCQRVAFSIFLCFFLRIRLRRFLISDPMSCGRLAVRGADCQVARRRQEAAMSFKIVRLDHVQLAMPPGGEDVAEAFYDKRETKFVNAVLDSLARALRPEELEDRPGGPTPLAG